MATVILLFLLVLWHYRKRMVYNPYDEKLSHSSYYEASFAGRQVCTEEIYRIFQETAGHKRLLRNCRLGEDGGEEAEVLLIHESGIYVASSGNMEGTIRGSATGRYWTQSFREGWLFPCRNYFYNPFLYNKRSLDVIQWMCRDMPKLPCYSMAVFGNKGRLETAGYMGDNRWAIPLRTLSVTVANIMRHNRKFLLPAQVELIYERLMGNAVGCGKRS